MAGVAARRPVAFVGQMSTKTTAARHLMLIIADDMQPEDISATRFVNLSSTRSDRDRMLPAWHGVPTPALDELTVSGVSFLRAFTPHGICTPARHALLTGRLAANSIPARRTTQRLTGRLAYPARARLVQYNGNSDAPLRLPGIAAEHLPVSVDFDATFARRRTVSTIATKLAKHGLKVHGPTAHRTKADHADPMQ